MTFFLHILPAWSELVFLALSLGALACRLWVLPVAGNAALPGHAHVTDRVWRFFAVSIAAALACSSINLLVRTAEMGGGQEILPLLPTVVLKTHFGTIWRIRTAGLVILGAVVMISRRQRDTLPALYFFVCMGAVIAMTESASGHAADAGDFSLAELADWGHLLGASIWGGGLVALSLVILPSMREAGDDGTRSMGEMASRFSRIAGSATAVIVITALYQTSVYVGSIGALIQSPYGWTIVVKIFLFLLLLSLAAFNRYFCVPRLTKGADSPQGRTTFPARLAEPLLRPFARRVKGQMVGQWFVRSVRIEAILMIGVLFCAALLRHEIPAKHYLHQQGGAQHHHGHNGVNDSR